MRRVLSALDGDASVFGTTEAGGLCHFRKKRSCGESVIACCSAKTLLALS